VSNFTVLLYVDSGSVIFGYYGQKFYGQYQNHHYVLEVPDSQKTADFFVQSLGFTSSTVDDQGWWFVNRDGFTIMLGRCSDAIAPSALGDHCYFAYFEVDDVDSFHEEIIAAGIVDVPKPERKPWNMREFPLQTPDGHRIIIGQSIISKNS